MGPLDIPAGYACTVAGPPYDDPTVGQILASSHSAVPFAESHLVHCIAVDIASYFLVEPDEAGYSHNCQVQQPFEDICSACYSLEDHPLPQ